MVRREILKLIAIFFSVRKSIAMMLTVAFCYLAVVEKISSTEFITVFTMVIGFYFGRSTALDMPGKRKEEGKDEDVELIR